jgi:hypothetical protein
MATKAMHSPCHFARGAAELAGGATPRNCVSALSSRRMSQSAMSRTLYPVKSGKLEAIGTVQHASALVWAAASAAAATTATAASSSCIILPQVC